MINEPIYRSAAEAVKMIKSGERVHFSGTATFPITIANALYERGLAHEIENVIIQYMHNVGETPFTDPNVAGIFNTEVIYTGGNIRNCVNKGHAGYISISLGESANAIRYGALKPTTAIVMVSAPDKHGYVSLGISVETNFAAIEVAERVIGVVNPNMPRTFGDATIHLSKFDALCYDESPICSVNPGLCGEIELQIAGNCASLIEDGSTLQLGIGNLPNAILENLQNHRDLGIHTEMFSDGIVPLCEKGVINNMNKSIDRGKIVASFIMGSTNLYSFVDNNPAIVMREVAYTNNPGIIAKNPKVVAINAAIEIDLTGQVNAESLGTTQFSGCGGQLEFVLGANNSKGGKAIFAMPSVTNKGISKIVPVLSPGAAITTPRQDLHYIVTEHGIADLYGKTLQARAKELTKIAHPDHREQLERCAFERFGSHFLYQK